MTIREDYINQMDANLKQWSTQLDQLQAKVNDAGAEQKAYIETAVSTLKAQQTTYREQMQKIRAANDAALADMRKGAERMAEEFAKAYAQAAGRFAA